METNILLFSQQLRQEAVSKRSIGVVVNGRYPRITVQYLRRAALMGHHSTCQLPTSRRAVRYETN